MSTKTKQAKGKKEAGTITSTLPAAAFLAAAFAMLLLELVSVLKSKHSSPVIRMSYLRIETEIMRE